MHVYELMVTVEDDVVLAYEEFMRQEHVPALEATGCFHKVDFRRFDGHRYRLRLYADTEADLGRYLRDHAMRLRKTFVRQLPYGVTIVRGPEPTEPGRRHISRFDRSTVIVERLRHATDL